MFHHEKGLLECVIFVLVVNFNFSLVNRAERPSLREARVIGNALTSPTLSIINFNSLIPFLFPPSTNVLLCLNDSQFLPTFFLISSCPLEKKSNLSSTIARERCIGLDLVSFPDRLVIVTSRANPF